MPDRQPVVQPVPQPDRRPDYVVPETPWDKTPMAARTVAPTNESGAPITDKPAAKAGKKE